MSSVRIVNHGVLGLIVLTIVISGQQKLPPVRDAKTTVITSTSVGLSWREPETNKSFTGYAVFVNHTGSCIYALYLGCPGTMVEANAYCISNRILSAPCDVIMTYNITDLDPYTHYTFEVAAQHRYRIGTGTILDITTNVGISGAPTDVEAMPLSSSTASISWKIPLKYVGETDYVITILAADTRFSSNLTFIKSDIVEGYNSTFVMISGLQSSWRYKFLVQAKTSAGLSPQSSSPIIITKPSIPERNRNLRIDYTPTEYLAVVLSWDCPSELSRNGHITGYTIIYQHVGGTPITLTSGSYFPEDKCEQRHTCLLPILPNKNYTAAVFANAEFTGKETTIEFYTDLQNLIYALPSNKTVSQTDDKKRVLIAAATGGSIVFVLFVVLVLQQFALSK